MENKGDKNLQPKVTKDTPVKEKEMEKGKEKQKNEIDLLSEINIKLEGISALSNTLDAILAELRNSKDQDDRDPLNIAYPSDGTLKTLPAGTTSVDFVEGDVVFPTGNPDELEDNLKKRGGFIRSLTIEAQTLDMIISFDGRRSTKIAAGRIIIFTNEKFRTLKLKTSGATGSVRFLASTSRNGAMSETK
jgi:hypothetical protein